MRTKLKDQIERLAELLEGQSDELGLTGTVADLRKQIARLEIDRDRKKEEYERREREVTHKVGLEKQRSEFEQEATKREARLEVREESLQEAQDRFEKEMAFQRERFEKEVGYLKDLLGQILARLPHVHVDRADGQEPKKSK